MPGAAVQRGQPDVATALRDWGEPHVTARVGGARQKLAVRQENFDAQQRYGCPIRVHDLHGHETSRGAPRCRYLVNRSRFLWRDGKHRRFTLADVEPCEL